MTHNCNPICLTCIAWERDLAIRVLIEPSTSLGWLAEDVEEIGGPPTRLGPESERNER